MMMAQVGASGPRLSLDFLEDVLDIQVAIEASATLTIEADGDVASETSTLGAADLGDWISPKGAAGSSFEVRCTVNSGSLSSGTTGSWLNLGSNRSWNSSVAALGGTAGANVTI
jgi:hypothetical protein